MIDVNQHMYGYTTMLVQAISEIDREALDRACNSIEMAMEAQIPIYVIGNGGSAAISQHFACDHSKGIYTDCSMRPNVISLATNVPLITAIANDISYDEVFAQQLEYVPEGEGLLIAISSSGNSPNIVKAIERAKARKIPSISFTGFTGGLARQLATMNVHVNCSNYGVVEDAHQMIMHVIAQTIRMNKTTKRLENLKL